VSCRRADPRAIPYLDVPALPPTGAIDIHELLGEGGPLELEIGFGRARFLLDRAAARPQTRFLGVETRRKWVHRAGARAAKRGLDNVVVRHGDAREAVSRLVPDACVERAFVNFPDPWWKARHRKRLVLTEEVGRKLARLLADRGELFVQTDVDFRAAAYRELLARCEGLEPAGQGGRLDENPFDSRSSREIRCEQLGLPVFRMLFKRRSR
jgi:tRNA (guanine-N7-)-methyltransferase